RFLCVTRQNDYSVTETNLHIEKILKQHTDERIFRPGPGLYHNQPVIITQNDYTLDIFNGDVGIIRRDDNATGEMLYAFFESPDGEVRKIPAGYLSHYETVFAMTIHKSQGSEFEHVVVILPATSGQKLLTRELLYTAVTRAKKRVLIFAGNQAFEKCINSSVTRASGLYERLMEEKV
ncbi:MAG: ATP-binding domain-containing protein, partial [Bacteroidales bacterium]|nr:ATP-binding domain-containing protein [Bacteroidales bacterium]